MGAFLALPEIIAASGIGLDEAVEISGGVAGLLSGAGAETLAALQASAALTAEATAALAVTDEAAILLSTIPVLTAESLFALQTVATSLGTVTYIFQTGDPVYQIYDGPGGLGPRVPHRPMALQVWLPQTWPWGNSLRDFPDWVLNLLYEVPSPQDILGGIVRGIATSFYKTGEIIIRRTASGEISQVLGSLGSRLLDMGGGVITQDPVRGLIDMVQLALEYRREWEIKALLEGEPIFRPLLTYDGNNIPRDGYNTQGGGFHEQGMWVHMPGETATGHYVIPSWMLFVLDHLEEEDAVSTKRKPNPKDGKTRKKRRL